MRRYYLASAEKRGIVDLREYQDEIVEAVHQIMPQAQVEVKKDFYEISPSPSKGCAIKIGKLLSNKDVLGGYCIKISKLFCSEEVECKECVDGTEKKCVGGHQ